MPLYDSFSAGQSVKLARMSTVPTTEDLKYLLSESKKHSKPVELPFEQNRSLFVIKVTLIGQAQTPRWTLQRGDGDSAKTLWTRDSTEIMMIQSKIKVESSYDSGVHAKGAAQAENESAASSETTKNPQPIVLPISRRNFAGWPQAPVVESPKVLVPPKPLPLAGFTAEFVASKESWPQLKDDPESDLPASAANNLAQVRSFARRTVEELIAPALNVADKALKGSPDSGKMGGAKPVVEIEKGSRPKPATAGSDAKSSSSSKRQAVLSITIPLPPPVQFDDSLVEHVFNRLFDRHTGLMSFGTLVFFLLREFDRFQRKNAELAIIILEVAVKRGDKVAALPYEALPVVADRIREVCAAHHVAAHVSGSEFAILLDDADDDSVLSFSESLHACLCASPPLVEGLPEGSTRVAIGAASIPNTCSDPGVLVAAAEMAKEMAKGRSPSYLLFPARSDLDGGWA